MSSRLDEALSFPVSEKSPTQFTENLTDYPKSLLSTNTKQTSDPLRTALYGQLLASTYDQTSYPNLFR
jgi:hypothetical protein